MDKIKDSIKTDPETPVGRYLQAFMDKCLDCEIHKGCQDMFDTEKIIACKKDKLRDEFSDKLYMRE